MKNNLPDCPVGTTLKLLENKWRILIIRDLMEGKKRFGELMKSISPISQRSLTLNLRELEEYNLIERKVYAEVPPRVEYKLSKLGESLKPILKEMWKWGEFYKNSIK